MKKRLQTIERRLTDAQRQRLAQVRTAAEKDFPPKAARRAAAAGIPATIRAARDFAGIQKYALEAIGKGERAEIPAGYALWLSHLDWLDGILEVDAAAAGCLSFEELEGLKALRQARRLAQSNFRECPHCHRASSTELSCSHCLKAFPSADKK